MSGSGPYPLAPGQQTLWEFMRFISPRAPGAAGINASAAAWLRGPLDADRMRSAVAEVAARHDALRIEFVDAGDRPAFRIADRIAAPLSTTDLTGLAGAERLRAAGRLVAAAHDRPFELCALPLWEVRLVRLAADHHVVVVSLCHLIGDGWSAQVLLRDLGAAYGALGGHGPHPAPPALGYRDVITAAAAGTGHAGDPAGYWRDRLTPLPSTNPLATAVVDTGIDPDYSIRTPFRFAPDLPRRVAETAARWRTTPFITLLGAYRALLGAWTGWDRVIIGTTTLGRGPAGTRDVIGQFTTNTYVAITVGPDATLREAVSATHDETVAAMRHATSFNAIARAVNPDFDQQRPWPFMHLYDAWFQSDIPARPPRFPGLDVEPAPAVPLDREPAPDVPPDRDPSPRAAPRRPAPRAAPQGPAPRAAPHGPAVEPAAHALAVKRQTPWILMDPDCRGGAVEYGPAYFTAEFAADWPLRFESVAASVVDEPDRRIRELRSPGMPLGGEPKE